MITRDVEVTGESLVPYGFGLSMEEAKGKKLQPQLKLLSTKKWLAAQDDDDRMLYTYQAK